MIANDESIDRLISLSNEGSGAEDSNRQRMMFETVVASVHVSIFTS